MAPLGAPPAGDYPAGWADLPGDILLGLFLSSLDCYKDRLAVAGVCKPWRRIVSNLRTPPLPWVLLPHRGELPPSFLCLLGDEGNLHEHPVPALLKHMPRHISSAREGAWLVVATYGRKYELVNFRSGARLALPTYMRDTRGRISDRRYMRISAAAISPPPPRLGYVDPTLLSDSTFSIPSDTASAYRATIIPAFMVAAITDGNSELAFWPLAEETLWTPSQIKGHLEDVIFCNNSFYVLTCHENIVRYHMPAAPNVHRMCAARCSFSRRPLSVEPEQVVARFLVASRGRLLMVVQIAPNQPHLTTGFRLFSIQRPTGESSLHHWVDEDLGDRMIFVGRGCSRSFDTSDDLYPGMGLRSGIYFLDSSTFSQVRTKVYPCHDMGLWLPHGFVDRPFPDQVSSSVSPAVWALPFRAEEDNANEGTIEEEMVEIRDELGDAH